MIEGILNAVKGQVVGSLTEKLGLNNSEVDTVLSSSQEALEKTVADEASNNGVDTLLNLFSENSNSDSANSLLSGLGGNLISSLTKHGFNSGTSSQIKEIVLPIIINFVSKKVGGDSSNLMGLLGGAIGGNNKDDLLGNIGSSVLKNLF